MNLNNVKLVAAACLLAVLAGNAVAGGQIELAKKYPVESEKTYIYVRNDFFQAVEDARVTAVYRPGSMVSRTTVLGETDSAGMIEWKPRTAGIVAIEAEWKNAGINNSAALNVSVKFVSAPVGGIMIMLFAGFLLLGGSVIRITRLVRSQD